MVDSKAGWREHQRVDLWDKQMAAKSEIQKVGLMVCATVAL